MYLAENGSIYAAGLNHHHRLGSDENLTDGLVIPPFFIGKHIKDFVLALNFSIAVSEENEIYICGVLNWTENMTECRTLNTSVISEEETIVGVGATALTVYVATNEHLYFMGLCTLGTCGMGYSKQAIKGWYRYLTQMHLPDEVEEITQLVTSRYGIAFRDASGYFWTFGANQFGSLCSFSEEEQNIEEEIHHFFDLAWSGPGHEFDKIQFSAAPHKIKVEGVVDIDIGAYTTTLVLADGTLKFCGFDFH